MTEFEYNLLIIQKDEWVREHLVELFEGVSVETSNGSGEITKFKEFMGNIEIQTVEGGNKVSRKLHIRTAGSSLEYLLYWERYRQHAVLLDLEIPADQYARPKKNTGMNLLKRIKKVHPEAQIIVFTDQMIQDEAIEAIRKVRHRISAEHGHNTMALLSHYKKLESKYASRILRKPRRPN